MRHSRIAQGLNVATKLRLGLSLVAALLEERVLARFGWGGCNIMAFLNILLELCPENSFDFVFLKGVAASLTEDDPALALVADSQGTRETGL